MKRHLYRLYASAITFSCLLLFGCGSKTSSSSLNPAPTIASLSTASVPVGNPDFTLQIVGTGFVTGTKVHFDKTELIPSSVTRTQMTVTVPRDLVETARVLDVSAVNPDPGGGISNVLEFTIKNPVPALQSLSTTSVLASSGDFGLTLKGSEFAVGATVSFGSQTLEPKSSSATELEVTIPNALIVEGGAVTISITNPGPGGGVSNPQTFTILNPMPTVAALSTQSALLDSSALSLDIAGTNFIPQTIVMIGSASLVPSRQTPTLLTVILPETTFANSGVLEIKALNPGPGGGTSNPLDLTVNNPVPVVSSLSLDNTLAGSAAFPLTINGSNFVSGSKLYIGSEELTSHVTSRRELSVVVPQELLAKAAVLSVNVSNPGPGGGTSDSLALTVKNPEPMISAISTDNITAGAADLTLQITGTNFLSDTSFDFGSLHLTPVSSSSTQIQVTIPASALGGGAVLPVTVTNPGPGGGTSNAVRFTIYNPVPEIAALSQQSVLVNSGPFSLDITGNNFVSQTEIEFGNVILQPVSFDRGHIRLVVPKFAFPKGVVTSIRAINPSPGGGASSALEFTVANPLPVVNSVSPLSVTAGGDGTPITLLGTGFVDGSVVMAGTTQLIPDAVSDTELQLRLPGTLITESGKLALTATNPSPGGGTSGSASLVIHGRASVNWRTVANVKTMIPGTSRTFNSFNQPSINQHGVVVFKGQSKGSSGPIVGIFTSDLSGTGAAQFVKVADNSTVVPDPNNTLYNGAPVTFTQFPSFPRIDQNVAVVAFRAQHKPVWTYTLPDSTESRIGSAGIYTNPAGSLSTGVGLFGALPDFDYMQVPGEAPGTRFDQFPGSPSITNGNILVFKGNYTIGDTGKTGVYYRDLTALGGKSPVELIANSNTMIPNQPAGGTVVFGSTAPPSAEGGTVVFVGLDNEDAPTLGGIYAAPLAPTPTLTTIVGIGDPVPGEGDSGRFNRLGEGLSFDGRYVAFWGAWGTEMRTVTLICPTDGEQGLLQTCQQQYPDGYKAEVPVHQGIFVYDMLTQTLTEVARTTIEFDDFVYWNFSGRPPGVGGGDASEDVVPEPPRWRSSSFLALAGQGVNGYQVMFKARTGIVDGIYITQGPIPASMETLVDTTMPGLTLDPEAPTGSTITSVGIEREGLRGNWLVINASMEDAATTEVGAGIYATNVMMH